MLAARHVQKQYEATFETALRGSRIVKAREAIRGNTDRSGPNFGACVFGEGPLANVSQTAFVGNIPWPIGEDKRSVPFDPSTLPDNVIVKEYAKG